MRIVLFNWRDLAHPKAGGAEVYTDEFLRALAAGGHDCLLFTSRANGAPSYDDNGAYRTIRQGSELTCRFHGLKWLCDHAEEVDLVIDEVNTLAFFSRLVFPRTVLLMHQLAREVWWKEAPFPAALVGYLLEPLMLQIYRGAPVITISKSSRDSFRSLGLANRCRIVECPLDPPVSNLSSGGSKVVGYVGRVTPSKRIDHILRAFAVAASEIPDARLEIVGRGSVDYLKRLKKLASQLGIVDRVHFRGHVSRDMRDGLMSTFDCLVMASLREGWGLVVSEAAARGVPAVAYDVAGLRDSVVHGSAGILVGDGDWRALARSMRNLLLDSGLRDRLGHAAAENLLNYSPKIFKEKAIAAIADLAT